MNKKILTVLISAAILIGAGASFANENTFKKLGTDVVNANKKVLKDTANSQTQDALKTKDKEIAKYTQKINEKQAKIKKVQQNAELSSQEKAKKIQALNQEIKELKTAIKELQK